MLDKIKENALVLVFALMGGTGAGMGWNAGQPDPRPFPYTSLDADARQVVVDGRVEGVETRLHKLETEHIAMKVEVGHGSRAMPELRVLDYRVRALVEKCNEVKKECCNVTR